MKLILSVDALTPNLSGIGRYTWELASGYPKENDLEHIRYYRNHQWIQDIAALLEGNPPRKGFKKYIPLVLRDMYFKLSSQGWMYHGTNYFLPEWVENGVITVHDLSIFKYPETHPVERIKKFEKDFFSSLKRAKHLITDSESTRQEVMEYLSWPADSISAVPLGVSKVFHPRSDQDSAEILKQYGLSQQDYALCVSTLEPRKKINKLLEAYSLLPRPIRDQCPLVLVGGKGWLSEELHKTIENAEMEGWLRYLGYVQEDLLPILFAGARIFVYPSQYEGFGLPILEAMASGTPVITSTSSCLPETAGGAALLVDTNDVTALAEAILKGINDVDWSSDAIAKGLIIANNLGWQQCREKTMAVYSNIAV